MAIASRHRLAPQAASAVPATCSLSASNPIPLKAAMKMLGRDTGELQLPMWPLTPSQEQLQATLEKSGVGELE